MMIEAAIRRKERKRAQAQAARDRRPAARFPVEPQLPADDADGADFLAKRRSDQGSGR